MLKSNLNIYLTVDLKDHKYFIINFNHCAFLYKKNYFRSFIN